MTLAESRLAAILVDMSFAWLNGAFVEDSEAVISVRDTGFLHGAGVFTTMRARDGVIVRLDAHLARVRESSEILFVPMIPKDEVIAAAANELLQRNQLRDARMRLTITRGVPHQDPIHGLHAEPTLLLTATPFEPYPREFYDKGMTVIALDPYVVAAHALSLGVELLPLEDVLARADLLTLHIALTDDTRHLLNAERLAKLQPHAILVNTARGQIVDEKTLAAMLREKRIAGVGLDVYEREPAINPELIGLPNAILLPHMASSTIEARQDMGDRVILNIKTHQDGHRPPDRVIPAML